MEGKHYDKMMMVLKVMTNKVMVITMHSSEDKADAESAADHYIDGCIFGDDGDDDDDRDCDDDDDDDDGVANDGYCEDSVAGDFCDDDNLSLGHLPFLH